MITNPILPAPSTGTSGNAGVTFLQAALPAVIVLGLVVGVVIFFIMLIIGAIQWISSGGDKQGIETARGKVTNAIVGLIILLALFAIIRFINDFFGVQLLNFTLPTINLSGQAIGG